MLGVLSLTLGCCADPEVVGVRFDPRFELQTRSRVAVLGAVLEGDPVWAYGAPASAVAAVSSHYRVGAGTEVAGLDDAPPLLQRALLRAQRLLAERGYRLATEEEPAQAYFSLSVGTEAGKLVRLGLHVGGQHEGAFVPRAISLVVAEAEGEDPCPLDLEGLVGELISALPAADDARQP